MDKFNTLLEAAECAITRCNSWSFAISDETYDPKTLLVLAETSDDEDPIDEDCFYVVSPSGAIGYCGYDGNIDWLFLSDTAPNEDLPLTYQAAPQIKFCPKCGASVVPGARFCGKCGIALRSK
jgi:ribosomal protein L40E